MLRWLPESVSTYGGEIDSLLQFIYRHVAVWFVLTHVLILYFLVRFRRRPGRAAAYAPGSTLRQAAWVLVPTAIVFCLDIWIDLRGARVWNLIKGSPPPAGVEVEVTGRQFNWEMRYPGPDGVYDTADDLQMDNTLHVPVGRVVRVTLKSRDVVHSFFVPHLRIKQDALPGRSIHVWFEVTRPGEYEIVCAELCGFGHSGMSGRLVAHAPAAYDAWVAEQWPAPVAAGAAAVRGSFPPGQGS
jgi:cytochrome c oxidase subunit 2